MKRSSFLERVNIKGCLVKLRPARVPRDADLHVLAVADDLVADVELRCSPKICFQALKMVIRIEI